MSIELTLEQLLNSLSGEKPVEKPCDCPRCIVVAEVERIVLARPQMKGDRVRFFDWEETAKASNDWLDCRGAAAVWVQVQVRGTTPSAVLTIEGAGDAGATSYVLPDPAATRTATSAAGYLVITPAPYIRARLASISGTGAAFTVDAWPIAEGAQPLVQLLAGTAAIGTVDTELPTAAALADATANPTAPIAAAAGAVFNGTTWDRVRAISAVGDGLGTAATMQPSSPAANDTAAANTAVVRTYAAVAGQRHRLTHLSLSYSGAPTGGRITVADGATTILDLDITAGGALVVPLPAGGLLGTTNTALTVTLAAGGAGVIGKLNTAKLTG